MINLKVDPEFQSQIPPLTDDEFKQLEEKHPQIGQAALSFDRLGQYPC